MFVFFPFNWAEYFLNNKVSKIQKLSSAFLHGKALFTSWYVHFFYTANSSFSNLMYGICCPKRILLFKIQKWAYAAKSGQTELVFWTPHWDHFLNNSTQPTRSTVCLFLQSFQDGLIFLFCGLFKGTIFWVWYFWLRKVCLLILNKKNKGVRLYCIVDE